MLDAVSIDQIRTFVAAVDEGSFSAAGRRLRRAQSVVSQTLAAMEQKLGLSLFDRSRRLPVLTDEGRAVLEQARAVVGAMDTFKAKANSLSAGIEAEVSVTVDVMFPIGIVTEAVAAFQIRFPETPLRLHVEALGAVLQPVLEGRSAFGVAGPLAGELPQLKSEPLGGVAMCAVIAPGHPLATARQGVTPEALSKHVQLVLTDRSALSAGREFGVMSRLTWRLADLAAKHAFLKAGLGWGAMPRGVVESDLLGGDLVELRIFGLDPLSYTMPMHAVYLAARPPGPAGRWLLERFRSTAAGLPQR